MKLVSLTPVQRGNWFVKASVFDDQILIFMWNEYILEAKSAIFYCEDTAYKFIERNCHDHSNCKTDNR